MCENEGREREEEEELRDMRRQREEAAGRWIHSSLQGDRVRRRRSCGREEEEKT